MSSVLLGPPEAKGAGEGAPLKAVIWEASAWATPAQSAPGPSDGTPGQGLRLAARTLCPAGALQVALTAAASPVLRTRLWENHRFCSHGVAAGQGPARSQGRIRGDRTLECGILGLRFLGSGLS